MRVPSAFTRADERMMRRALVLAARGLGETSPNPAVGCVVARDGRVVGEGFHARAGGPHAEVAALLEAGTRARGATLYVTLEPCAHHGRTPPCAPLVRDSGIARVVAATRDPHPLVAGRGLALLRRAGVAVETGLLAAEAARLNERFLSWARRGRPFVLLKAASTLDGRIATAAGRSKWITSAPQRRQARVAAAPPRRGSRRDRHGARRRPAAAAVAPHPSPLPAGGPRLEAAASSPVSPRPHRPPRTPVLALCCAPSPSRRRDLERAGVEVAVVQEEGGRVSVPAALEALASRGVTSLMVEGGGEVLGSFLAARLLDQVALFRAPLLLGGRGSRPAFGGPDPLRIQDALRLEPVPDDPAFPWPWPPQFELWRPKR